MNERPADAGGSAGAGAVGMIMRRVEGIVAVRMR